MESVLLCSELLSHIFSFLNFSSIKSVRCVSKFWKQQSEYYKFWENVELKLDEYQKVKQVSKELHNIISIISLPLSYNTNPYSSLKKISACPRLKELYMCHLVSYNKHIKNDFSKSLLSIIPRLNILKIEWCNMSSYQLTSIYQQITNLELLMSNDDHRDVPANVLALALTKVKIVNLKYANLSTEQLTLIYQQISSSSNCNLKHLKINYSDHTNVDTELLITALSKLKVLNISTCRINFEQFINILNGIGIDRRVTKLEKLFLFSVFSYEYRRLIYLSLLHNNILKSGYLYFYSGDYALICSKKHWERNPSTALAGPEM